MNKILRGVFYMKDIIFKGVGTAIATPFDANDNINFDEFKLISQNKQGNLTFEVYERKK